jgi:superkiller protein 3
VESIWRNVELGLFGRAAASSSEAVAVAASIVEHRPDAFNLWKAMGDACSAFSWIQSYIPQFPTAAVQKLLITGAGRDMYEQLSDIDEIGQAAIQSMTSADSASLSVALHAAILAHKRAVSVCAHDIHAQAVAWYNLGWTEYRAHVCLGSERAKPWPKRGSRYLQASVRCFKRAIELEAGNADFWNSLGIVTTHLNPKVAQHAFVRSLHLNDMSASVWTNLGTLYLLQGDIQLSNEAFTRAQSSDPEYSHAWLGQGILALLMGEPHEAQSLFTHAFEISDSTSFIAKRLYATSAFDSLLSSPILPDQVADLLRPLFALHQLKSQVPSDVVFRHLGALFAERIGSDESIDTLTAVCATVEAEYELSESSLALARFAQAQADLARAQLAARAFGGAADSAQTALDLSADPEPPPPDPAARRRYRLSAHLTAGLANHHAGATDAAVAMFRTTLHDTAADPAAICLLAQVLWATAAPAARAVAREQLLDCVDRHPDHVGAMTLLGAMALLDDDADTVAAVAADLHGLRARADADADTPQQRATGTLLAAVARLDPGRSPAGEAARAVMLHPCRPDGWARLAEAAEEGAGVPAESVPARMAVLTAAGAVPARGMLGAVDLCRALARTGWAGDAQRAVMVAPWAEDGWVGMGDGGVVGESQGYHVIT